MIGDRRSHRGYVAFYRVDEEPDNDDDASAADGIVRVLAIRSQRESDYR